MKKWLLVLLTLVLSLTLALGISACKKDEEHTHDWSQEWSADETNHWHNCNGCDQHTGTAPHEYDDDSDATCNICGHTRHIHTYKWEHDNEYHWQVKDCHPDDEIKDKALHDFSNGPVCPVCNFDSTGVHLHEYEWQYDGENHWEQSTCADHDPVTRNSEAHSFDPATGLCKCGVSKSEVDVYSLYKANETLKGSTVKSLMDWKNDLKEEGIDHVALTSVGDGALYTLVEDTTDQFTEEVRYFAPRTLNLNAAYKNGSLTTNVEEVCFVVKCKVNGDYQTLGASQVLAVAKTDSSGNAALTFTPVFGYSSSTVEYIVSLAAAGELPTGTLRPIPNGYKILDGDATKTLTVSAASATLSENFTVYRTLGAGDRGELDNIWSESYQSVTDFYLDETLTEGIYKVVLTASSKGFMSDKSTFITVNGGGSQNVPVTVVTQGSPDNPGGVGMFYVKIADDSTLLSVDREIGAFIGDIKLTKVANSDLIIDTVEKNYDLCANSSDANISDVKYDISALPDGLYIFTRAVSYSSTTPYFSIGTADSQSKSIDENKVFEKTSEDITLSVSANLAYSGNAVHNFKLTKVEEVEEGDAGKTISFDADHKSFKLAFTPTQTGTYSIDITTEESKPFDDLSVTFVTMNNATSTNVLFYDANGDTKKVYFPATESLQCLFTYSTKSNEEFSVTVKYNYVEARPANIDEEFDVTFAAFETQIDYKVTVPKGLYFVKLTGDNLENVSLDQDSKTLISRGSAGSEILTAVFYSSDDSKDYTFKFAYNGADNYPTVHAKIETIVTTSPTSTIGANSEFTVSQSPYALYKYEPAESNYCTLILNSESDYSALKVYTFSLSTVSDLVKTSSSARTGKTQTYYDSSSKISSSSNLYLLFVYDMTGDYPSVTADFHYSFKLNDKYVGKPNEMASCYEVQFDKVAGADSYELWMATANPAGPGSNVYSKVADFGKDDPLTWTYNGTYGGTMKFSFYYVAKDSTGKYADTESARNPYVASRPVDHSISFAARQEVNVTLTVPEGFNASLKFEFICKSIGSNTVDTVNKQVTASEAASPIKFLVDTTANQVKITMTDEKYALKDTTSTSQTLDFTKSNPNVAFEIVARPAITVTVNVPEDYKGSVNVYVEPVDVSNAKKNKSVSFSGDTTSKQVTIYATASPTNAYKAYISGSLATGYAAAETEVDVSFDAALNTGTATLNVSANPLVTVTMTFPENVTGKFTVKFYTTGSSSSLAGSVQISGPGSDSTTATGTVRLPKGEYTVKVDAPSNSGYTVDETTLTVDGDTEELEITVKDRITVTVTLLANKQPDSTVYFEVYEKGTGTKVGSTYSISKSKFTSESDSYKAEQQIYLPDIDGKSYEVRRGDSTKDNITFDTTDITVEGKTGTAAVNITVKAIYKVTFKLLKGYVMPYSTTPVSGNIAVYKNGEEIVTKSINMSAPESEKTVSIEFSEDLYDENAVYTARLKEIVNTTKGDFYCPGSVLTFSSSTNRASVSVTLVQLTGGSVTMNVVVPEDFTTGTYNIKAYEVGGVELATIAENVQLTAGETVNLGTDSATLPNVSSPTCYWEFTSTSGDGIICNMGDNTKPYGVTVTNEGTTFTATIAKRAKATVTVTAPEDFASKAVTVIVLDSSNKMLLKQDITVSSTSESVELYLPELSGCKLLYLAPAGYTAAGPETYTAESEAHTAGSIAIQVTQNT